MFFSELRRFASGASAKGACEPNVGGFPFALFLAGWSALILRNRHMRNVVFQERFVFLVLSARVFSLFSIQIWR